MHVSPTHKNWLNKVDTAEETQEKTREYQVVIHICNDLSTEHANVTNSHMLQSRCLM